MTYTSTDAQQPTGLSIKIHTQMCTGHNICHCPEVTKVNNTKYLGVYIDNKLKWNIHTRHTATRIRRTIYKYRRLRHIISKPTLRQVYFAITQSIAQYSILAWGGCYSVHMNCIEVALRSVMKVALRRSYRYPSDQLYEEMDAPTLTEIYIRQLLTYRFKHTDTDEYINHGKMTRQNTNRHIVLLSHRTSLFTTCHLYKSIKLYNQLPTSIKILPTFKLYKKEMTAYVAKNMHELKSSIRS